MEKLPFLVTISVEQRVQSPHFDSEEQHQCKNYILEPKRVTFEVEFDEINKILRSFTCLSDVICWLTLLTNELYRSASYSDILISSNRFLKAR